MSRIRIALSAVFAATLVVAGCSQPAPATQSAPPTAAPAPATSAPAAASATQAPAQAAAPAQPPAGTPVKGGELVYARAADADALDPQYTIATEAAVAMNQLYDTLIVRDRDGATYKPLLAKSWNVSPDGLTYTFTLRDDVKFHSGKKLTSADVKYTLDRWRGNIRGKASVTKYYLDGVATVEAPDDTTVVLKLSKPNNFLLDNLSMPFAGILNKESVEKAGDDYGSTVVDGTGPFKLKEWNRSDRMVLVRNPDYTWGSEVFGNTGPAYLDQITVRTIPEASTRAVAIQRGEAQILRSSDMFALIEQLRKDGNLSFQTYDVLNVRFMALKTGKPKLSDARVRQALNLAVDRQTLVNVIDKGLGLPAYGFLHPSTPYAWDKLKDIGYKYDPDGARKLLDEAGWTMGPDGVRQKGGEKLSLDVYAGQDNEEELTLIQSQMKEVGIQLNLKLVDRATLSEIRRTETPDINYIYTPYDNAGVLFQYFHSSQQPSPNRFNYADPTTDKDLETAQSSPDKSVVAQAYQDVQQRVHEAALTVPLVWRQNALIVRKEVQGLQAYPLYDQGLPKMTGVWLQK